MAPTGKNESASPGQSPVIRKPLLKSELRFAGAATLRLAGAATLAGLISGLITGGALRLVMRIITMVAGHPAIGQITDNGNVVGEITLGGTGFLVLFVAFLGMPGAVFYVVVRRWIPGSGPMKGVVFGALLLLILGSTFIDITNPDFLRFGSRLLNVALFAALPVVFGLLVVLLLTPLERAFPAPRNVKLLVPYIVLFVFLGFGFVGTFIVLGDFPIELVLVSAPMAYGTLLILLQDPSRMFADRYSTKGGYVILAICSVVGGTQLSLAIYRILSTGF